MTVTLPCYADVCLLPLGAPTASVSDYIVQIQLLTKKSGLKYTMHSAGTTVEGPWNEVFDLVGQWHEKIHSMGIHRVQSSIRTGTRTDKPQTAQGKIDTVNRKLAELEQQQEQ